MFKINFWQNALAAISLTIIVKTADSTELGVLDCFNLKVVPNKHVHVDPLAKSQILNELKGYGVNNPDQFPNFSNPQIIVDYEFSEVKEQQIKILHNLYVIKGGEISQEKNLERKQKLIKARRGVLAEAAKMASVWANQEMANSCTNSPNIWSFFINNCNGISLTYAEQQNRASGYQYLRELQNEYLLKGYAKTILEEEVGHFVKPVTAERHTHTLGSQETNRPNRSDSDGEEVILLEVEGEQEVRKRRPTKA